MKRYIKLTSRQQEQSQELQAQGQHSSACEFATPEEMLRHDALHTPVPPRIAYRLQESINQTSPSKRPWWQRLFRRADS